MARFVTSSSSSEATHATRRSPEPASVEQAKAEADRKSEESLRRYKAKIQNGDYTDADYDNYVREMQQVMEDFAQYCINSLRRPE